MFSSQKVGCFLNGFAGHGDDPETKELKLTFHIPGISYELAAEISPLLSDRLFRKNPDGEWMAAEEVTKANFSISVPMQNITFYSMPEGALDMEAGVRVEGCAISNLRASRPFVEARLEFDVVMPMDKSTMRLIEKYYKATVHLSMEEIQRKMDLKPEDETQAQTGASLQDAADAPEEQEHHGPKKGRGRPRKSETVGA